MPLCASSCETTHQQKAPIHRCGAECSYIHSFSLKENMKERETPESLGEQTIISIHQRTALYHISRLTKGLLVNILSIMRENDPISLAQR